MSSKSGAVLNTFTPRAAAAPDLGHNAVDSSELRASADRVAWLTNGMEYIEFSLDGRELDRFEGPAFPGNRAARFRSLALSASNEVIIGVAERGTWNIWALDRQKRAWVITHIVAGIEQPTFGRLLGFDGSSVIADVEDREMLRTRGQPRVLRRYTISSAP
jgi:hypothetical protein